MNPELIVAAMLNVAGVNALVGTRKAMGQLPQGTSFPALVYTVIDSIPTPKVNFTESPTAKARIQINPLAGDIATVKSIHAAVRAAMDFKHQAIYSGKRVISSRLQIVGPASKDNEAGVWTQPADYFIQWYE